MSELILSKKDVLSLSQDLSVTAKTETIKKIGMYYNDTDGLSLVERQIAEEIFRIMVEDVEVKVREALVDSIKDSGSIPEDVILAIVNDENSVSIPFIREYKNLNDTDLVSILKSQNIDKQKAVAMRKRLSSSVSHYIASECTQPIVETLLVNQTADIQEITYNIIIDKYINEESIKEKIVERAVLPVSIVEKIISSLSDILAEKLLIKHNLPDEVVSNIISQVRDKTTIKLSQAYASDKEVELLVSKLYSSGKLSNDLVVRSICMGDLKFFEYALAILLSKEVIYVRKILNAKKDDFEIRNLFREAKLPSQVFSILLISLRITQEVFSEVDKDKMFRVSQKVIERLLTLDLVNSKLNENDIEYLISKIG